jgi:carboxylesterase type B
MRALPADELIAVGEQFSSPGPYVGGSVLDRLPVLFYEAGEGIHANAVMLGGTSFEGISPWFPSTLPTSNTQLAYMLSLQFWSAAGDNYDPADVAAQYPIDRFYNGSATAALVQSNGDQSVLCPLVNLAENIVKAGIPVYHYFFNDFHPTCDVASYHEGLVPPEAKDWASHASDLLYIFPDVQGAYKSCPFGSDESAALSRSMIQSWAGFIKNGVPFEDRSNFGSWLVYSHPRLPPFPRSWNAYAPPSFPSPPLAP